MVTIVKAPIELKDQITELCRETYETHRNARPQDWPGNFFEMAIEPMLDQSFRDRNGRRTKESSTLFVACEGSDFAGYIRLSSFPTEPNTEYFSVELQDIYVLPEFRGRGIARALIRHVKELSQQHDWDRLTSTVSDWNEGSRALFESEGFTVKSREFAFGPERPARDWPPLPRGWHPSRLDWIWIALTGFNLFAVLYFLLR